MTARNDVSRPDWVLNWPLPATGTTLLNVTPTSAGTNTALFSYEPLMGLNNFSITFKTLAGSTAVGTLIVECTDFITREDVFLDPTDWAPMNYPNSAVPVTQAVATGANTYNIQVSGTGVKYIRVRYNATSGTGTINAAISCRANSRT